MNTLVFWGFFSILCIFFVKEKNYLGEYDFDMYLFMTSNIFSIQKVSVKFERPTQVLNLSVIQS